MNYSDKIAEGLEFSFVDLLELIQEKFGNEEFVLDTKNMKALRRNQWQVSATSAGIKLAPAIRGALEKMAKLKDPCVEFLDSAGKSLKLLKLPSVRGKASIRSLSKAGLVKENADLRGQIEVLQRERDLLNADLDKERETKEFFMKKAGDMVDVAEKYEDFPDCYSSNDFGTWLVPIQKSNGKRPYFIAKPYWATIEKKLPFIATWVSHEGKFFSEKQSAAVRAKIKEGKIAPKASKLAPTLQTIVCQFFRFVAMTNGLSKSQFTPSSSHLLSQITMSAFLEFFSQYTSSPKTVANSAKIFTGLYKYMLTLGEFQNKTATIKQIVRMLYDKIKQKKLHDVIYRTAHQLDTQKALRGEWLNHSELSQLNSVVSEELKDCLERFDVTKPKKTEVYEFQRTLILFCFLQTGGQRREVIVGFQTDNFAMCGDSVVHFTLHEKVQKRDTDRITLPETLGGLLRIWVEKYRPILCPAGSVVTQCFVGLHGKPLRPKRFSACVQEKIADLFPGRNVTPLTLRRIMVTEMLNAAIDNPNKFFHWAAKHAALINTSKVMAETVYNCGNKAKQAQETLDTINDTLKLRPSDEISGLVREQAAGVAYLTKNEDDVKKIVDKRFNDEGELQYLCKLASGKKVWHNYGILERFTHKVSAYLAKAARKKKGLETDSSDSDEEAAALTSIESECDSADEMADFESDSDDDAYCPSPRKRKRSSESVSEDVFVGNTKIEPGHIVSVAPRKSAEKFWLAKIVTVVNEDEIRVQWLEKQGKKGKKYTLLDNYDNISALTFNGVVSGKWLDEDCYLLEKTC